MLDPLICAFSALSMADTREEVAGRVARGHGAPQALRARQEQGGQAASFQAANGRPDEKVAQLVPRPEESARGLDLEE